MHGGGRLGLRVSLHRLFRERLCAAAQQRERQRRGQHENQLFHSSSFWEIHDLYPSVTIIADSFAFVNGHFCLF